MRSGHHSRNGFLTALGLEEAAQREGFCLGVDGMPIRVYLDEVGSVSALVEVEDDCDYDERHVELNHRSAFLQLEIF